MPGIKDVFLNKGISVPVQKLCLRENTEASSLLKLLKCQLKSGQSVTTNARTVSEKRL